MMIIRFLTTREKYTHEKLYQISNFITKSYKWSLPDSTEEYLEPWPIQGG